MSSNDTVSRVDSQKPERSDAPGAGWLFKISVSDQGKATEMMDEEAYEAYSTGL